MYKHRASYMFSIHISHIFNIKRFFIYDIGKYRTTRIPFEANKNKIIKNVFLCRGFLLDLVTYWHPLKYFSFAKCQADFI